MPTPAGATALFRRATTGRPLRDAAVSAAVSVVAASRPSSSHRRSLSFAAASLLSPRLLPPPSSSPAPSSCQRQQQQRQKPRHVSPLPPPPHGEHGRRLAVDYSTRCFSAAAGGNGGAGSTNQGTGSGYRSALRFETIVDGKPMVPEDFEGKAVLVVNTASLCGLTPQLKELEMVHKRFGNEGLVVIGVPSNDFGGQEPWEEQKIKEFYAKDFGVTFPLTSKTAVVGPEAHPLYSAVVAEFGADAGPQWNFHKLLVDADGDLAGVFGSNLSPLEPDFTEAIEEALPSKSEPST